MGTLDYQKRGNFLREIHRILCLFRWKFFERNNLIVSKDSFLCPFPFVRSVLCIWTLGVSLVLGTSCVSLLPSERRVYPKNPVKLPAGMDIHDWMETKKKQFPDRLRNYSPYENSYKIMFYRKEFTRLGSYISCGAYVRQTDKHAVELIEMVSNVNYADYSISNIPKGGELGPMNEKERTEILLPCIEEFLTPPQLKE
ncbi:hypothetical protein [Leptospira biflexa]|uniref:hypothetical protein n=1 Tax=Leptospira biflexa TaxID=172 RepID=UPI001083A126|nr:hypothetical protein [Leptospira biflexa]TGM38116.1 hypothetical protein EHQ80_11175 [Leptospira biflexa]TGM41447.1 hypothetical protein EHQ89_05740 [Leptospira biflexa]